MAPGACSVHPLAAPLPGSFCPSCLRERLALMDADAARPASAARLRRCRSLAASDADAAPLLVQRSSSSRQTQTQTHKPNRPPRLSLDSGSLAHTRDYYLHSTRRRKSFHCSSSPPTATAAPPPKKKWSLWAWGRGLLRGKPNPTHPSPPAPAAPPPNHFLRCNSARSSFRIAPTRNPRDDFAFQCNRRTARFSPDNTMLRFHFTRSHSTSRNTVVRPITTSLQPVSARPPHQLY